MRLISERISFDETKKPTIVILGKTERWKESMLLFWVLAWSFCGAVFLYYFFADTPMRYSLQMLLMLSFWAYFEIRIVKVFIWRRVGFERVTYSIEELIIQNNFYGRGKKNKYFINNIESFQLITSSPTNFFAFMDNSFWVMGAHRIYFDYFGKKVVFGMQLNDLEAKKLLSILNGQLKKSKKEIRKKQEKTHDKI